MKIKRIFSKFSTRTLMRFPSEMSISQSPLKEMMNNKEGNKKGEEE